jgi:hypothetical protein
VQRAQADVCLPRLPGPGPGPTAAAAANSTAADSTAGGTPSSSSQELQGSSSDGVGFQVCTAGTVLLHGVEACNTSKPACLCLQHLSDLSNSTCYAIRCYCMPYFPCRVSAG